MELLEAEDIKLYFLSKIRVPESFIKRTEEDTKLDLVAALHRQYDIAKMKRAAYLGTKKTWEVIK